MPWRWWWHETWQTERRKKERVQWNIIKSSWETAGGKIWEEYMSSLCLSQGIRQTTKNEASKCLTCEDGNFLPRFLLDFQAWMSLRLPICLKMYHRMNLLKMCSVIIRLLSHHELLFENNKKFTEYFSSRRWWWRESWFRPEDSWEISWLTLHCLFRLSCSSCKAYRLIKP